MLPRPAMTVWSRSAAFTGVSLPCRRVSRWRSEKLLPKGSGPRSAKSGWVPSVGNRSIAPKRRASLKVTRAPLAMCRTTWSCFFGRGWWVVELAQHRARHQHAPRHAEVPQERLAGGEVGEQVFRTAAQRGDGGAVRRSAMRSGSGQRRSGRFTSARAIVGAFHHGREPRRTVSTSGSSGIVSLLPLGRVLAGEWQVALCRAAAGAYLVPRPGKPVYPRGQAGRGRR